jgi:hypothetical protein
MNQPHGVPSVGEAEVDDTVVALRAAAGVEVRAPVDAIRAIVKAANIARTIEMMTR